MRASDVVAAIAFIIAAGCVFDAYWWNKGKQTLYRFFLVEGKLRLPAYTSALVAANLSLGNFIVFITTWGYTFGIAGIIVFVFNLALNVAGFYFFFSHFRRYIESHDNNGTIHDYLSRAYAGDPHRIEAKRIRLVASIVTVVGLTLAIVFELSLAVNLLAPANQLDQVRYFGGLAFLIALFTAYGGFRTLITSDIANASVLTAAVLVLLYFIFSFSTSAHVAPIDLHVTVNDFLRLGWPNMLSIAVIGFGWMLVAMDQWQRTCASRSFPTSRDGLFIYFPILSAFAIAFALWGAFDKSVMPLIVSAGAKSTLSGASNPLIDIAALPAATDWSHFLVVFVVSGLVFAAISTTNTFLNVCSHSFTTDILVGAKGRVISDLQPAENKFYVGIARAVIVGMVAIIMICYLALTLGGVMKDPLGFFFIAYSVQFALLPCMVISALPISWRPTQTSALLSLCIGFAASLGTGFGSWYLSQISSEPLFSIAPSDWITLAPVVTVCVGMLPLIVGLGRRSR